ncbi:MAG: DUF3524 domain-containing protein [Acidimicrobiia bacterium]|nr:DUF3524 domain-containing protein [Acidimicrobiia bacterium]
MKILIVEPYLGGSHQAWAEGYAKFSRHDVRVVGHEARFWKWRMQGSTLTLADETKAAVEEWGEPDVLLVSDMLHLPAFLGAARRFLGDPATVLYMHENQLTYPVPPGDEFDLTYGTTNWLSMAVADEVWFNSEFHRTIVFEELPRFLKQFPDHTHEATIAEVMPRSRVVPVGIDLSRIDNRNAASRGAPLILWNHRWEHDKGPEEFFAALDRLGDAEFRVAICGENFRQEPAEFTAAKERLGDRVVQFGWAPDDEYVRLLSEADIVVSTSQQEFFGISVVEAMYAGAFPVLPNRLSYPGLIPKNFHSSCLYDGADDLVARLEWALSSPVARYRVGQKLGMEMARYDWSVMAPTYDDLMQSMSGSPRL